MENSLMDAMTKVFAVVSPMLLAWLSANVLSHFYLKKNAQENQTTISLKDIRYYVEKIVLSIFLPLVFMFSVLRTDIKAVHLVLLSLGLLLPILTMLIGMGFHSFSTDEGKSFSYWKPFMPATFGGGNRGTLLVILLSPLVLNWFKLAITTDEVISYFAVFDVGNFIILMFVIRKWAMPKYAHTRLKTKPPSGTEQPVGAKGSITDIFQWFPSVAVTFGLISYVLDKIGAMEPLKHILFTKLFAQAAIGYSSHISSIFAFLTFLSIFILFKEGSGIDLGIWTRTLISGIVARALALLFVILSLYFSYQNWGLLTSPDQFHAALFCVAIFLILPPSSLFSLFVEEVNNALIIPQSGGSESIESYKNQLASLVKSTNYLYLIIMAVAIIIAFIRFK
jgi:hypothetical protein